MTTPPKFIRLTKPQQDMLDRIVNSETADNPAQSIRSRWRMFDRMKAAGWFDAANQITDKGRHVQKDGGYYE